jgi:hypothetical protein
VAVTFCPLTGSGLAWSRSINGQTTTFGVSGLIYKNNLIAYDRRTESRWSQMLLRSVQGPLRDERPQPLYPLVQLRWDAFMSAFPNVPVLAGRQGSRNDYASYPYGVSFPEDDEAILFPITNEDDRLSRKTLVHGLFYESDISLVFPISDLTDTLTVNSYTFNGKEVVIAGSSDMELAVSYYREHPDGTLLHLSGTTVPFPAIMQDQRGTVWDVFGRGISGPHAGTQLDRPPAYHAYWYAWVDFFGAGPRNPVIGFQ